jgi:hypothetical protein
VHPDHRSSRRITPLRALAPWLIAGGLLVGGSSRALAQDQDTVSVRSEELAGLNGEVVSAMDGKPIPRALVYLVRAASGAVTDSSGKFSIEGIPPGTDTLIIRYGGFDPQKAALEFEPRQILGVVFVLSERIFEVAELRVEVRGVDPEATRLELRQRMGGGVYITREQIRDRNPNVLTEMVREIPRVDVLPSGIGAGTTEIVLIGYGAAACKPKYYVDGLLMDENFELNNTPVDDVALLEIYRSPAEAPTQYRRGGMRCGAILIWIREGPDENP